MEDEDEQSIEAGTCSSDLRSGGHAPMDRGICSRHTRTRGRQTDASWEWSRAGRKRAWPRMQRDTTVGLDWYESRHLTVSAARLAHGSGARRASPAAALREVRPTDRKIGR